MTIKIRNQKKHNHHYVFSWLVFRQNMEINLQKKKETNKKRKPKNPQNWVNSDKQHSKRYNRDNGNSQQHDGGT